MRELLKRFVTYKRFNNKGKDEFINHVYEWTKVNLKNFDVSIQISSFIINYKELFRIIFLFINTIILFYLFQELSIHSVFADVLFLVIIYIIQFKLVFLFLSVFFPSKNIILDKKSNCEKKVNVIVSAHYDTKNCFFRIKNNPIISMVKYNFYSISRLVGQAIFQLEKAAFPITIFFYCWYIYDIGKGTELSFLMFEYSTIFSSFIYNLGIVLIFGALLCTFLIYLLSYPLSNTINNSGADDNTSGVVGALEIARRLDDTNINADIKIILFDNEEKGLIGSNHYVIRNLKSLKLKETKIINLDCIGRGNNIYITTDNKQKNHIIDILEKKANSGIKLDVSTIDYSDHKPFIHEGLNAVTIGRYNSRKYLWLKNFPVIDWIHGCEDDVENIDFKKIEEVVDLVVDAIKTL